MCFQQRIAEAIAAYARIDAKSDWQDGRHTVTRGMAVHDVLRLADLDYARHYGTAYADARASLLLAAEAVAK